VGVRLHPHEARVQVLSTLCCMPCAGAAYTPTTINPSCMSSIGNLQDAQAAVMVAGSDKRMRQATEV
jgi:hypothetical protein